MLRKHWGFRFGLSKLRPLMTLSQPYARAREEPALF